MLRNCLPVLGSPGREQFLHRMQILSHATFIHPEALRSSNCRTAETIMVGTSTLPKKYIVWLLTFLAPLVMQQALAAKAADESAAWQSVITQQLKAFRAGDGAAALKCAGAAFKESYSDPSRFYADIVKGYEPLVKSRSHTFGEFKIEEGVVGQIVNLVGPDKTPYMALYILTKEADGWRIQNVNLKKSEEGETV